MKSVNGVILCGGQSTRLGQDKAKIVKDGEFLITKLHKIISSFCDQVYLSARNDQQLDSFAQILPDTRSIGPMGGISDSLSLGKSSLVISCDLAFLTSEVIEELMCHYTSGSSLCYFNSGNGFYEPLVGVYDISDQEKLEREILKEQYSLNRFLKDHSISKLNIRNEELFRSINTQADLEFFMNADGN